MAAQRRQSIIDLHNYMGKRVQVKFMGGRVVQGVLVGFDKLFNLVLTDNVTEDAAPDTSFADSSEECPRVLSSAEAPKVVCRGSQIMTLTPMDGFEEIANPWLSAEQAP